MFTFVSLFVTAFASKSHEPTPSRGPVLVATRTVPASGSHSEALKPPDRGKRAHFGNPVRVIFPSVLNDLDFSQGVLTNPTNGRWGRVERGTGRERTTAKFVRTQQAK